MCVGVQSWQHHLYCFIIHENAWFYQSFSTYILLHVLLHVLLYILLHVLLHVLLYILLYNFRDLVGVHKYLSECTLRIFYSDKIAQKLLRASVGKFKQALGSRYLCFCSCNFESQLLYWN